MTSKLSSIPKDDWLIDGVNHDTHLAATLRIDRGMDTGFQNAPETDLQPNLALVEDEVGRIASRELVQVPLPRKLTRAVLAAAGLQ